LGLLKRGAKTQFKNRDKKEEYTLQDLLDAGFNDNIKNFLSYEKLYDILDISDSLKDAFKAAAKQQIQTPIKLKISTIHGSKGREAQHVLCCFDCSKKVATEARKDIDSFENEVRVFYVGQSRAIERLVILRNGFKRSDPYLIK
jgi:superfamily I DNA/RNA helicase